MNKKKYKNPINVIFWDNLFDPLKLELIPNATFKHLDRIVKSLNPDRITIEKGKWR